MCCLCAVNLIPSMTMEIDKVIYKRVIEQAVRDLASKDPKKQDQARDYFRSDDFRNLSVEVGLDFYLVKEAIELLLDYPLVSRKKMANEMNKVIEEFIQ